MAAVKQENEHFCRLLTENISKMIYGQIERSGGNGQIIIFSISTQAGKNKDYMNPITKAS